MTKSEYISRYGQQAYDEHMRMCRAKYQRNKELNKQRCKEYYQKHKAEHSKYYREQYKEKTSKTSKTTKRSKIKIKFHKFGDLIRYTSDKHTHSNKQQILYNPKTKVLIFNWSSILTDDVKKVDKMMKRYMYDNFNIKRPICVCDCNNLRTKVEYQCLFYDDIYDSTAKFDVLINDTLTSIPYMDVYVKDKDEDKDISLLDWENNTRAPKKHFDIYDFVNLSSEYERQQMLKNSTGD